MPPVTTDTVCNVVCWSVSLYVCHDRESMISAEAEPIMMSFGMLTQVGPRNHTILDGGADTPYKGAILSGKRGIAL